MLSATEQPAVLRRSKGERTKKLILESAIVMLAEHGIKGTTHRAIATHANLQLSLTTYYFKDIQDLVQQAFELNAANAGEDIVTLWQPILALVAEQPKKVLRRVSQRMLLREELTDSLLALTTRNVEKNRQQVLVEQQLFNEALVSSSARLLAGQHYQALLKPCQQLCQYFNKEKAKVNAEILLNLLKQAHYHQLLAEVPAENNPDIRAFLHQALAIVLGLKP